jgi:hypothetical protein
MKRIPKGVGLGTTLKIALIYQWKQVSKISHHVNYIFIFFMNLFGHWKNGILWSPYHVKKILYFMLDLWIPCTKHWCLRLFEIQGLLLCLIVPRLEKNTNEMEVKWTLGGFFHHFLVNHTLHSLRGEEFTSLCK